MENIILKNQKQLYGNLPSAQLGSKFTKLANRFACKSHYPMQAHLPMKTKVAEQVVANKQNQKIQKKRTFHSRVTSSLESSQLDYFKQINTQLKQQNQNLKQDLKINNEKMNRLKQEKQQSDQKLRLYHRTIHRSQKKINGLMQLAHNLILMVKDKIWMSQQDEQTQIIEEKQQRDEEMMGIRSPLDMKRKSIQKELDKIEILTKTRRDSTSHKKKTIQSMLIEEKSRQQGKPYVFTKKSTFYDMHSQNTFRTDRQKSQVQESQDNEAEKQMKQLMNSLQHFQKDMKELKILKKIMQGITQTFQQQTQQLRLQQQIQKNESLSKTKNYVIDQIGRYFTTLIQKQHLQCDIGCKIQSQIYNEKIKPTYTSYRLYTSIKEIFDHQIYLLENQKMLFLQYKNKRLLKFIYECSGCERYEEMFNEVFRILREGFKEIKCKIMPQLKAKQMDEDLDVLL